MPSADPTRMAELAASVIAARTGVEQHDVAVVLGLISRAVGQQALVYG